MKVDNNSKSKTTSNSKTKAGTAKAKTTAKTVSKAKTNTKAETEAGLFKNAVGRPSNEIKRKRKIVLAAIIALVIAIVGSTGYLTYSAYYNSSLTAAAKNFGNSAPGCNIPYQQNKCKKQSGYTGNETVYKIQQLINNLGKGLAKKEKNLLKKAKWLAYYNVGIPDGYYGPITRDGVKRFQRKYLNNSYGNDTYGQVGPYTLKALVNSVEKYYGTKTTWYQIDYNLNGGKGTLDSTVNNVQVILSDVSTSLPSGQNITNPSRAGYKIFKWELRDSNNRLIRYYGQGEKIYISKGTYSDKSKFTANAIWAKGPSATMPVSISNPANWRNYISRGFTTGGSTVYKDGKDTGTTGAHLGIDFTSSAGEGIYAVADGQVVIARDTSAGSDYGNFVVIKHTVGGSTYYSFYAHLKDAPTLTVGQNITAATRVGTMGQTGNSTGVHLHFEMRTCTEAANRSSCAVDPSPFLDNIASGKGFTK